MLKEIKAKLKDNCAPVLGLLSFCIYIYTMMLSYSYETSKYMIIKRAALISLSALFFLACFVLERNEKDKRQLFILNAVVYIYHVLYIISSWKLITGIRYYSQIYNEIIWIGTTVAVFAWCLLKNGDLIMDIRKSLLQNKFYIIVALLFSIVLIVLSNDVDGPHFVWDSDTMYEAMLRYDEPPILNFSSSFRILHIDFSYFHSLIILSGITGSIKWAFFYYNAIMLVLASFGAVFIVRQLWGKKDKVIQILCMAICLFSPYIFGISTYYSYDFGIGCLAFFLFLFAIRREWILFFITGLCISFMKETGLIFFAGTCLAVILLDASSRYYGSILKALWQKRTVTWLMVAGLFLKFHSLYGGWGKMSLSVVQIVALVFVGIMFVAVLFLLDKYNINILRKRYTIPACTLLLIVFITLLITKDRKYPMDPGMFGFSISHVVRQIKVYFVLNYAWIWPALILGALFFLVSRKKKVAEPVFGLFLIPAMVFFFFNCLFVTYEGPRYTDAFPVCMMLTALTLIGMLEIDRIIERGICFGLVVLNAASSLVSFDPFSKMMICTTNIGKGVIYAPLGEYGSDDFGGDQSVYNRQYYGLDVVLDSSLKKAFDSDCDLITVSLGKCGETWAMDGGRYSYGPNDGKRDFTEFWNIEDETRAPTYIYDYFSDPGLREFSIRYIFHEDSIEEAVIDGKKVIYIYMPSQNEGREDIFRENVDVQEEGSFTSHGWVMSYIIGNR